MKPYAIDQQRFHWSVLKPGNLEVIDLEIGDDGEVGMYGEIPPGGFAAIGSFDGVHLGHAHVLDQALQRTHVGPYVVIFFDPHPQTYFRPDATPFRLSRIQQQMKMFDGLEMDYAVVIRFNDNLARMSADDFARKVLKDALQLSYVSAGFDFNFGAGGAGKAADLEASGATYGFEVAILPCQIGANGQKLSSSAVREALRRGDTRTAEAILGRPHMILGEVIVGARQGRTIGFPTINLELGPYLRPKYGVYITETRLDDGRWIRGVSNIGIRPTVGGDIELLETYLFDFDENLYGAFVETALLDYIRPEAKFASFEAMKAGIARDVETARAFFAA